jgi:hypothetical protein
VWNSETTELDRQSASNQRLLERLEAENAQLRGCVVELVLKIQALRDGCHNDRLEPDRILPNRFGIERSRCRGIEVLAAVGVQRHPPRWAARLE